MKAVPLNTGNGKKLPAENKFFSSAAKPEATVKTRQTSESKATGQKTKPEKSSIEPSLHSSGLSALMRAVEPKFHALVDILWSKRSEGILYLSLSELGAALLQKDKGVYEKAGVKRVKKYATLASKDEVVIFSVDKSGSDAGTEIGEFVGLHPRLAQL